MREVGPVRERGGEDLWGGVSGGGGLVRVGGLESEKGGEGGRGMWRERWRGTEGTDGTFCRRKASSAGVMKFGM